MEPIITVNDYPIGWEWLANVPLEDFNWLIDIFATMTDNTDTYDFVFYEDSETLPGHLKRICSVDKISLANFLNEDQGYESGISMYGHYIPGQDKWSEHFPTPGKLRPSNFGHIFGDTQSQFNKLLRTQQKLRNKKK